MFGGLRATLDLGNIDFIICLCTLAKYVVTIVHSSNL